MRSGRCPPSDSWPCISTFTQVWSIYIHVVTIGVRRLPPSSVEMVRFFSGFDSHTTNCWLYDWTLPLEPVPRTIYPCNPGARWLLSHSDGGQSAVSHCYACMLRVAVMLLLKQLVCELDSFLFRTLVMFFYRFVSHHPPTKSYPRGRRGSLLWWMVNNGERTPPII